MWWAGQWVLQMKAAPCKMLSSLPGHLRTLFSLGWEVAPHCHAESTAVLVLLIKMENMCLCDAFNHFGIVKSSGLWRPGRPWCKHKLA